MITLRQLKHFRAVLELGSMRHAANALAISQPALTSSIGKLEQQLGSQLFIRNSNGMEPTEFAKKIIIQSYEIVNRVGALQTTADSYQHFNGGSLRIGVQQGILRPILEDFFPDFVSRFPNLNYSILERSSGELINTILRDNIDIAIAGFRGLQRTEGIRTQRLKDLDFWPVVRADHPLAGKGKVSLKELLKFPMASCEIVPQHLPFYHELAAASPTNTQFPRISCADYRILLKIIMSTDAFMAAPKSNFKEEIKSGELTPLNASPFNMNFQIAVIDREDQFHTPVVAMFIDELVNFFKN